MNTQEIKEAVNLLNKEAGNLVEADRLNFILLNLKHRYNVNICSEEISEMFNGTKAYLMGMDSEGYLVYNVSCS